MDRRSFLASAKGSLAPPPDDAARATPDLLDGANPAKMANLANGRNPGRVANLAGQRGLRLSTTWGLVSKLHPADALALLARLGYDGYEMFDWRNPRTLDEFVALKDKYPLRCECLTANKGVTAPGCGLVNPRERDEYLRQTSLAIEAAKKMDCPQLVTLTGNDLGPMARTEQMTNAVEALREAAPMLEKNGVTAIVEVLNTYVDHAGYFLYYVRDGVELVDRVGSPNVKVLFDIYHVQIMEGNLIKNIRDHIDRIGHFHIGDVPGRHQPGTGEIDYRNVFQAIYDLGDRFKGSAALEYSPLDALEDDLAAIRRMANFA